jgi:hypothetical protein
MHAGVGGKEEQGFGCAAPDNYLTGLPAFTKWRELENN